MSFPILNSFKLVSETWRHHGSTRPQDEAIVHCRAGEPSQRWKWGELISQAERFAAAMHQRGVRQGDVCAIIIRHHYQFYPIYMGLCALGAIPSILAFPNARLHPDKFRSSLAGMAKKSGLKWLLSESEIAAVVEPLLTGVEHTIESLFFPLEDDFLSDVQPIPAAALWPAMSDKNILLLQHSSGTTGLQKAVELSHYAVLENLKRYGESIEIAKSDKIATWLPLYHDMGLIAAFHLPLAYGLPIVQIDPFEWVAMPQLLLEAISKEKCTLSWLPNFAYNLLANRVPDQELENLDFNHFRMFINCSEPVRAESHAKLSEKLSAKGMKPAAFSACYAMAEMTFAATQTAPHQPARELIVNRAALINGGCYEPVADGANARHCVSSGKPISGVSLKIMDEAHHVLPQGRVGEIYLKSVSMFSGYRNDPEKSKACLDNNWFRTGDVGFCYEDELYVIGRKKDVIIVAGKNIYPEDIEDVVNTVPGALPGRNVAFGYDDAQAGTEKIAVIVESDIAEDNTAARKKLRLDTIVAAMQIDVTVSEVFIVPPRWLIKSSSGKLSRQANKERILDSLQKDKTL